MLQASIPKVAYQTMTDSKDPISLSDRAAERIGELKNSEDAVSALRVYVEGGGCSGFQYGFQLDTNRNEDDVEINKSDNRLWVDSLSLQYLEGSTVDYVDDLMGARFVVTNPNASGTCGCGASFSV